MQSSKYKGEGGRKLTPFSITDNRPSSLAAKLGVQAVRLAEAALEPFHLMQCISLYLILTW